MSPKTKRPIELLCSVASVFIANDISSKLEMVGVERNDLVLSMLRVQLHVHGFPSVFVWPGGLQLFAGAKL